MNKSIITALILGFFLLVAPVSAQTPFSGALTPAEFDFSGEIEQANRNPAVFLSNSPYSISIPENAALNSNSGSQEDRFQVYDPNFPPMYIALYPNRHSGLTYQRRTLASRGRRNMVYLDIAPIIKKYAGIYHLDPHLVKAVIRVESEGWNYAVSYAGASGLMQLMPGTAELMGCRDMFDPKENIKAGCKYLREMLNIFGDLTLAIAAYNAGPGAVRRAGGIPYNWQTPRYVQKVFNLYYR